MHDGSPEVTDRGFPVIQFPVFSKLVSEEYKKVNYAGEYPYSLDEVLHVFKTFFDTYEQHTGEQHPAIKRKQIRALIEAMPFCDDDRDGTRDIYPEDYAEMIAMYFQTKFDNCDYRISHFFSGLVRQIKLYEAFM